jgi:NAD(P)-dependent dehydrogenase (short-subunit alcohol dehydrogenase family)
VEELADAGGVVAVVDVDADALRWIEAHPRGDRLHSIAGDANDDALLASAVTELRQHAPVRGWVNNAAVFDDAALHEESTAAIVSLVNANLAAAVAGTAAAVRAFLDQGSEGAIVNVSSHQARRPVPGCLPYVVAKSAIEGLTRAVAVDYGHAGIRANAVALGSIAVERYTQDIAALGPVDGARVHRETGMLHALERVGTPREVAAMVAVLLSDQASFVSGVTLPIDGGRAVLAREPDMAPA